MWGIVFPLFVRSITAAQAARADCPVHNCSKQVPNRDTLLPEHITVQNLASNRA